MRGSPSLHNVLRILWISDHGGSWIKMMSYWVNNSRRDVTMTEFFRMFCENILRFLIIIGMWSCLLQNELTLLGCPESRRISFDATLCWICASKMDIGLSPPGGLLSNSSTWMNADRVCLSWFPTWGGSSWRWLCSTIRICGDAQTYAGHCIWCIWCLGLCMKMLNAPTSNNFCIGGL